MADNVLNGLIPTLYEAADVVSRELTGFIPAVMMDADAGRAAVGQTVNAFQTRVAPARDIVPAMTPPNDGNQTVDATGIEITHARAVPILWNGEQTRAINSGPGQTNILRDQFAQAMRTLINEVEATIGLLYYRASRACGTAGTTPFASDLDDTAALREILSNNGAPLSDLQLVINTRAGRNMRTLENLTKANEAGGTDLLRQGTLLNVHGFNVRESAGVANVNKGSGSGYLVNASAGYAAGAQSIAVDTGTGTILAGDILTFDGDTDNMYVSGAALAGGVVTLNAPGLIFPKTNNAMLTVGNSYTANMAFARSAIQLAIRAPALPIVNGVPKDMAIDRVSIADPLTGIAFDVAAYLGYQQVHYEVSLAWGAAVNKPEHTAILLG